MTKHKIWIKVVPQIVKDLTNTLLNCKGTFEINTSKSAFFIADVSQFSLDGESNEAMYRIQIETENNSKDLFIAKANVIEFTVHFN